MDERLRFAYDLSRVIDQLDAKQYPSLVTAVKAFHATCSVELDLKAVRASVEELILIDSAALNGRESHLGQALLTHAVITYARATHSKAIARFNVGVIGAYDKRMRNHHKEIVTLRDKCLAHFGPGDDLWHDERVLYLETFHGNAVTMAHRRVNFSRHVIDTLNELVTIAMPYLKKLQKDRAEVLNAELGNLPLEVSEVINAEPFIPARFYGDGSEAEKRFWEEHGFFESYDKDT